MHHRQFCAPGALLSGPEPLFTETDVMEFLVLRRIVTVLGGAVLLLALTTSGCDSQLEQTPPGGITPDRFFETEQEALQAVGSVYAQLRTLEDAPLHLQELTTDELVLPVRSLREWRPGFIWRDLHQHTWTPGHPFVRDAWNTLQSGIGHANSILQGLTSSALDATAKARFTAELRFLRAYFYSRLLDLFGGVPIVVEAGSELDVPEQPLDPDHPPPHHSRRDVFDFVLRELTGCSSDRFRVDDCIDTPSGILQNLASRGEVPYGRATRGAGYALLARLLLNAEVYAVEDPSTVGEEPAMYEAASAAAEAVLAPGRYRLADDYFEPFAADNHSSPEIIFAATHKATAEGGFRLQQRFLHYNHPLPATPRNGYATLPAFYKAFALNAGPDGKIGTQDDVHVDERGHQFLVGRQYESPSRGCSGDRCFSDPTSAPVTIRGIDTQLDITLDIPTFIIGVFDIEPPGARPMKWEIDPAIVGPNMGNDFPLFRLAEMYLIKAEAENELGNRDEALAALNAVRTRAGLDPIGSATKDELRKLVLQERGFEFVYEGLRRPDLIRYELAHGGTPSGFGEFGGEIYAPTFTGPWFLKGPLEDPPTGPFRALFPIPEAPLDRNPNLRQNPGY